MVDELDREIGRRVAALGYELVELERAGSKARPILRVRIEVAGSSAPGGGVTVEDCTRVSRALEEYLDQAVDIAERYLLEVSSPGVERPLVKPADYARFAGREVAVKTLTQLADGSKRVEGELLGLETVGDGEQVRVRKADGTVVNIPRAAVARANLIFRWNGRR
ncbi:MAG TPA: ribosome maturation factor RimP [Longimicrobiales bacterium]|nr:ribosome maturation factor RimP [Longimicrobiales bacterium]